MKKILLGLILLSGPALAQVSVYSCDAHDDPTQAEILNSNGQFYRGCVDLSDPGDYTLQQNFAQEIKASSNIHVTDVFHAGPYTGNANTHMVLGAESPFDVAVMNYPVLNYILRYKKLELGIVLPEPYQTYVENFEAKEINPSLTFPANEIINPFLEWELDVEAHFKKVGTSTETVVDGFFTNEIERDYDSNDWIATSSSYPMRIRFAPPENGNWECYIVIKVGETGTLVSTSAIFPFSVIESGNAGYVSVHQNQKNLKRGENMIFPIGQNFAAPVKTDNDPPIFGISQFDQNKAVPVSSWKRYMDAIENYIDLGGKYIRTNQLVQGNLLEWEKKGNYYGRLHYAWEQDKLLELLEANDVLMQFTLMNQEPYMLYGNYDMWTQDWDHYEIVTGTKQYVVTPNAINPYNDNPQVKLPHEGLTMPSDLKYHKQRTRYYIARYGYSTSIYAFELLSEPFHVGEFSPSEDYNYPGETAPYLDVNNANHTITKQAISTYTNEIGDYVKNHLHHTNQLLMCNGVRDGWNPTTLLSAHDNSIYSPHIDVIGVNYYNQLPNKLLISQLYQTDENSLTKSNHDFRAITGKPVLMSECGSGDFSLNCSQGKSEVVDAMTYGFTDLAGFNMWHALFNNEYHSYEAHIGCLNHMNSHTIEYLSNGDGNWTQWRQMVEPSGTDLDLKEHQYYISEDYQHATGYIYNRTYNTRSNSSDPSCLYNIDDVDNLDYYTRRDLSASDGSLLAGPLLSGSYKIEYYSYYESGGWIGEEIVTTIGNGYLPLDHPELLANNQTRPVVWYLIYPVASKQSQQIQTQITEETINDRVYIYNNLSESEDSYSASVYPNPSSEEIFVESSDEAVLFIYDLNGSLVCRINLQSGRNILENNVLAKGIYVFKIQNNENVFLQKMVKN